MGRGLHRADRVRPIGRLDDRPETPLFHASWQDESEPQPLEEVENLSAEAAIGWGRARAEIVFIRLGGRGDTYFSAGDVNPVDDEGPLPEWPPAGQPAGGWWDPPAAPTFAEVERVAADVAAGTISVDDAAWWAFDRIAVSRMASVSDEVIDALLRLIAAGDTSLRLR